MKIIYEHIPYVRSVSLGMWVHSGSRHEQKEEAGASHFIEHMLFKGTKTRSAKQIADEMDQIGGELNAYTTKEYTCYYVHTLTTHLPKAINILADMFLNSTFDISEIEKEKTVIIEEINMYEDSPEDLVHDILEENIWKTHSLGSPISGKIKDIENITRDKLIRYFNKYYTPQNTVISIVGYFEESDIIKQINSLFGNWQTNSLMTNKESKPLYKPAFVTREKSIEQIHMCIGFPGVSLNDKNLYAMSILNTAFGGGMSSRLFQKIREERGLVYSIYSYSSVFIDTGLFSIYAGLNPNHTLEVSSLIKEEIDNLFTDPITESILYNTKEQLKTNYILGLESTNARMSRYGKTLLLLNKLEEQDEIIDRLEEVSLTQIESLIKSIFSQQNMSFAVVGDLNSEDLGGLKSYVTNNN